jgi:hypothetical protein
VVEISKGDTYPDQHQNASWQGTLSHKSFSSETIDLGILESDHTVLNSENDEERVSGGYLMGVERRVRKRMKILQSPAIPLRRFAS